MVDLLRLVLAALLLCLPILFGVLIGINYEKWKRLRLNPLLAQYESLTAYTRLRVLPFLETTGEAKTLPVVLRAVLSRIDVARGGITVAQELQLVEVLKWAYEHNLLDIPEQTLRQQKPLQENLE